jgi:tRNA pseudouridine38-40 synthase
MARYKVVLAYDGTCFSGYQRQASEKNIRTVQAVFETALRKLTWQGNSVLAAGRTDTGVHASGQVVAFDLEWNHNQRALLAALNANLPQDVAVCSVKSVAPNFHPRFDATERTYRYRIFCDNIRNPLRERYSWRVWPEADFNLLDQATTNIHGTHDFRAFGNPPQPEGTTIRHVFDAVWQIEKNELVFYVTANAFLYRMVRRLVRCLVNIGQKRMDVISIQNMLETGNGSVDLAPPHGLALIEVKYPADLSG